MQSAGRREIVLVAAVVVVSAAIGLANLRASRRDSAALVCLSNMRTLMRGAGVYASDHALAGTSLDVDLLARAGLVTAKVGRCPLGGGPGPDYIVTLRDGRPVEIRCAVDPLRHRWSPDPHE